MRKDFELAKEKSYEFFNFDYKEYFLAVISLKKSLMGEDFLYAKNLLGYSITRKEFQSIEKIIKANFYRKTLNSKKGVDKEENKSVDSK